jgi:hypothetical protein
MIRPTNAVGSSPHHWERSFWWHTDAVAPARAPGPRPRPRPPEVSPLVKDFSCSSFMIAFLPPAL